MPPQDRGRCDYAMPPQHLRQPLDECGEDRSVCPVQAGLGVGSAQHGDFVTRYQELTSLDADERLSSNSRFTATGRSNTAAQRHSS
jgi:hypothetical protein